MKSERNYQWHSCCNLILFSVIALIRKVTYNFKYLQMHFGILRQRAVKMRYFQSMMRTCCFLLMAWTISLATASGFSIIGYLKLPSRSAVSTNPGRISYPFYQVLQLLCSLWFSNVNLFCLNVPNGLQQVNPSGSDTHFPTLFQQQSSHLHADARRSTNDDCFFHSFKLFSHS